jgi:hypothetical protein
MSIRNARSARPPPPSTIQDQLLAQGEFEPVPAVAMAFAKEVAAAAGVTVDELLDIAPIAEAERKQSRQQQQQQRASLQPDESLARHFSPMMIRAIGRAKDACLRANKTINLATDHQMKVFAQLVGLQIYKANQIRTLQKMSAREGQRYLLRQAIDIGLQRPMDF